MVPQKNPKNGAIFATKIWPVPVSWGLMPMFVILALKIPRIWIKFKLSDRQVFSNFSIFPQVERMQLGVFAYTIPMKFLLYAWQGFGIFY